MPPLIACGRSSRLSIQHVGSASLQTHTEMSEKTTCRCDRRRPRIDDTQQGEDLSGDALDCWDLHSSLSGSARGSVRAS